MGMNVLLDRPEAPFRAQLRHLLQSARERLPLYLILMRADRPAGALLLLWPTLWALWMAAGGWPSAHLLVVFVAGVFLTRSAGCVINDLADRDFDPHVERTRGRPLATELRTYQADLLASAQNFISDFVAAQPPTSTTSAPEVSPAEAAEALRGSEFDVNRNDADTASLGSNALGVGSEDSQNGHGLVLAHARAEMPGALVAVLPQLAIEDEQEHFQRRAGVGLVVGVEVVGEVVGRIADVRQAGDVIVRERLEQHGQRRGASSPQRFNSRSTILLSGKSTCGFVFIRG